MASPLSNPNSSGPRSGREFEDLVANLFRQHGWRVKKEHLLADKGADLVVARGNERYIIELKAASEGRPDRLVPSALAGHPASPGLCPGIPRTGSAARRRRRTRDLSERRKQPGQFSLPVRARRRRRHPRPRRLPALRRARPRKAQCRASPPGAPAEAPSARVGVSVLRSQPMDAEGPSRAPRSRRSSSRAAARIPQRFRACGGSRGLRDERLPFRAPAAAGGVSRPEP